MRKLGVVLVVLGGCAQLDPSDSDAHHAPLPRQHEPPHHPQRPHPHPHPPTAKYPEPRRDHDHRHSGGGEEHREATCAVIGGDGGTIAVPDGPTLTIPAGAIAADTAISVAVSSSPAPSGAITPRYTFSPSGLSFARPVAIAIPVPASAHDASLYWSRETGPGFDRLGGTLSNNALHASVVHFSDGYVAANDGSMLAVTLTLVVTHYVAGQLVVPTPYEYPDISIYAPTFFYTNGSGLTQFTPAAPVSDAVGHHTYLLPSDTTAYEVRVMDPLYQVLYYAATGDVDIGTDYGGRIAPTIAMNTPSLDLVIDGLTPWDSANDQLYAASPVTPMAWSLGGPADAQTSVDDTVAVPDDNLNRFLIQHSKGDVLDVGQMTQATTPITYLAQTRVAANATIEQTDTNTPLLATLHLGAGTPQTAPTIDFPGTTFTTMLGLDGSGIYESIGATAQAAENDIYVYDSACPGSCISYVLPLDQDSSVSGLGYATAAALSDTEVLYEMQTYAQYQLIGTTSGTSIYDAPDGGAAPGVAFSPLVGPVTNVRFSNGSNAYLPQTGVGQTPTITWDAIANADHYYAALFELDGNAGDPTTKQFVASFTTDTPKLELPMGVLAMGTSYVIRITTQNNINLQRLDRRMDPWARVRWASGVFTP